MPQTSTSPLVGSSRLPAMVSSVDLPDPLGPITATISPARTDRSTPPARAPWPAPDRRSWTRRAAPARSSPRAPLPAGPAAAGPQGEAAEPEGTGAGRDGSAAARLSRVSAASSHRVTASSRNNSASTTSARPRSSRASPSFSLVHCCISSTRYRRCAWITSCASVPGTRAATSTFITSSSRGGEVRSGGVRSQAASASSPRGVIRNRFCGPSCPVPSDSASPSRSSRPRVLYT